MSLKVSRCLPSFVVLLLVIFSARLQVNGQQSMCAPVSNNPLVMENLCNDVPRVEAVPAVQKTSASKATQNLLTLTAADINSMRLTESPLILMGDVLVFEANRDDFILEIYLSNGKEIVTQPQVPADAKGVVGWKKGRAKLDYFESLNQHIIGMKITALHQSSTPLLLRGVKIDRKGRYILELEKSNPGPKQKQFEPPMSYPPDPHVMTVSVSMPSLGRESQTGFMASHVPAFSMAPMMFQSGGADGNHYKYTGKEFDAETGLYYYGARYYSPALGRFTSPDPKIISRQRMLDPQQWNMYSYSRNNPTSYFDPDGKEVRALDAGALTRIQQTLPANVRSSVVAGQNGVISSKALNGVQSNDANFQALKGMVNAKGVVEASTGPSATNKAGKTDTFKYETGKTPALKADYESHGITPDPNKVYANFTGETYSASESKSGNIEVHLSDGTGQAAEAPGIELTVTMGHELYVHGQNLLNGQPAEHENTRDGPVNKQTHEVEERTRKNAQEKDPQ
jgi:RHS repeat-associated protein